MTCRDVVAAQKGDTTDFVCDVCGVAFSSHVELASHKTSKHGVRVPYRAMIGSSICKACLTDFRTRIKVIKHVTNCSKRCRAWYDACGATLSDHVVNPCTTAASNLTSHRQTLHKNIVKPYTTTSSTPPPPACLDSQIFSLCIGTADHTGIFAATLYAL